MSFEGFGLSNSVQPFDLKIHRGEVVGVAGLLGSGRTEMARLMFGIDQADSGALKIDGVNKQVRNPREAVELGSASARKIARSMASSATSPCARIS